MPTKEGIRQELSEKRNEFTPEAIKEMSRQIAFKLYQQDEFLAAQKAHIFTSFGSEPDTNGIREYALHLKKIVYVPVIERERREFHNVQVQPNMKYEEGLFGVPNPVFKNNAQKFLEKSELNLDEKDVVIVPLLAFDGKLHRLGYGHGYYDRFLERNPAFKIGLAFDSQRVEEIPTEEFDIPLDMIITETEVLRAVPLTTSNIPKALEMPQEEEPKRRGARAYDCADEVKGAKAFDLVEVPPSDLPEELPVNIEETTVENIEGMAHNASEPQGTVEEPQKKKVVTFGHDDLPDMPKREE